MNSAWPAIATEWDEAVAAFLRANPDWLARHPDLYRSLTPPARVHGEAMADHMAAMLLQERRHAEVATEQQRAILAASRSAATMLARVHEVVLALVATGNAVDFVLGELPHLMAADASALCANLGHQGVAAAKAPHLEALLGQRDVLCRQAPTDAQSLYAEAALLAVNDILVRLPGLGVLALAFRDPIEPLSAQAQSSLRFLGSAVAAALLR